MDGTYVTTITDKSAAPQPSSTRSWAQVWEKLIDYFLSNVITTVWSVLLFTGGLIFLFYFGSIGFRPEMDVKVIVTLLAASVLTAGFLCLGLILYLFAPFVLWKTSMPNYERLQILCYKDGQYAPARAFLWVGLPFIGIVGGFSFYLYLATHTWGISSWWGLVPCAISLLMPPIVVFFRWNRLSDNPPCILRWRVTKYLFRGLVLSFLGILLTIYMLNALIHEVKLDLIKIVGLYLVVLIWNCALVINISQITFRIYLIIALIILPFIFMVTGQWLLIPNRVMNIYKFGNLPDTSLIFDEIGCSIVQQHGMKVTPYTPNSTTAFPSTQKTCSLSKVTIHSRLGSTYYLQASRNDNTSVSFTIPAQNVLSWAVNEPKAENKLK